MKVDDYMNNKGFTLLELLAVIIILSLLAVLVNTSVTKLIKDSKNDLYDVQIENIKMAAESWGADNIYLLPKVGECKYLTIGNLKNYGLLDKDINDLRNSSKIKDDLKIKITNNQSDYGTNIIEYEVNPTDIEGCDAIYKPICKRVDSKTATFRTDDTTKTVGNIPKGEFALGDEYICEVKKGVSYHFYVLSTTENKVNLILDGNLNSEGVIKDPNITYTDLGTVEWISLNDYDLKEGEEFGATGKTNKGPITAVNKLYDLTKSWNNIPNMVINYTDSGNNYGMIKTIDKITTISNIDEEELKTYKNLKARLPLTKELTDSGCKMVTGDSDIGSCPLWVSNYLKESTIKGATFVTNNGYWTLDSVNATKANRVSFYGYIVGNEVADKNNAGIRPVITIEKYNFE